MGRGSDQVLRDLLGLQEEIYRLFDEQSARVRADRESVSSQWAPPVDIYETDQAFVLVAEVPGVPQEDIHLEVSKDRLVLQGERPLHTHVAGLSYHRIERPNGLFQRVFRLPAEVDSSRVSAVYRDGVLQVTVPKRDSGRGRAVAVQVEG